MPEDFYVWRLTLCAGVPLGAVKEPLEPTCRRSDLGASIEVLHLAVEADLELLVEDESECLFELLLRSFAECGSDLDGVDAFRILVALCERDDLDIGVDRFHQFGDRDLQHVVRYPIPLWDVDNYRNICH